MSKYTLTYTFLTLINEIRYLLYMYTLIIISIGHNSDRLSHILHIHHIYTIYARESNQ